MGSICLSKKTKADAKPIIANTSRPNFSEDCLAQPFSSGKFIEWKQGDLIAEGDCCKVFQCINVKTGELLVVKSYPLTKPSPFLIDSLKKVKKEARILKTLDHKNILKLYQVDHLNNSINLVTECVPGGCLEELLVKYGKLEEEVVKNYLKQAMNAINYLNTLGISHNSVSAGSFYITSDGVVKLSGFQYCTLLKESAIAENDPSYRQVAEFSTFLAPEILAGTVSHNSDVWSLGCLAIQLLTGKELFSEINKDQETIIKMIRAKNIQIEIPKCSGILKTLIQSCLKLEASERPGIKEIMKHEAVTGKKFSFDLNSEESLKMSLSKTADCNAAIAEMDSE
jgi:serine/threonine protein kinase